jgi:GH24 family phage-related lysozyme (muramidase)
MQDQNGVVSDQYTDYNYHWTDGSGNFVHTNDQTLDPNRYLKELPADDATAVERQGRA